MGGIGSTRWGPSATKRTTDDCLAVDVRMLKRIDKLMPGVHSISWDNGSTMTVTVNADVTNALFQFTQHGRQCAPMAFIAHTACHYGGERPWFVCDGCERRYAVLFVSDGSIACRCCHNLLYTSQIESEADRAIRKAQNLGIRLGFGPNLVNGELMHRHKGPPPNMTQHTYNRLLIQYTNTRIRALLMV